MSNYCTNILPKEFIPTDAKFTENWFKAAAEYGQSTSCVEARVYSLGCLIMGSAASSMDVLLYSTRAVLQPIVHLINLDTAKSFAALSEDVQAACLALYTTALGVISAASTIFYPGVTRALFHEALFQQPLDEQAEELQEQESRAQAPQDLGNLQQQLTQVEEEKNALQTNFNQLRSLHNTLTSQMSDLKQAYTDLEEKYCKQSEDYKKLLAKKNEFIAISKGYSRENQNKEEEV